MNVLPRIGPQYPICSLDDCKIMLIGEAPGKDEIPAGIPFVGRAGKLLDEMLFSAEITRNFCYVTNVFLCRPPNNKVKHFFASMFESKAYDIKICEDLPQFGGSYLKEEFVDELDRLINEVDRVNPDVCVTLGATPTWAFTGLNGITKLRGNIYLPKSFKSTNLKVVPTFHPAYILRNLSMKETAINDLKLAKTLIQ